MACSSSAVAEIAEQYCVGVHVP